MILVFSARAGGPGYHPNMPPTQYSLPLRPSLRSSIRTNPGGVRMTSWILRPRTNMQWTCSSRCKFCNQAMYLQLALIGIKALVFCSITFKFQPDSEVLLEQRIKTSSFIAGDARRFFRMANIASQSPTAAFLHGSSATHRNEFVNYLIDDPQYLELLLDVILIPRAKGHSDFFSTNPISCAGTMLIALAKFNCMS